MGEVGTVVSKNELKKPESLAGKDGESKVEEEFTVARLYVSKMKSEVKNLVHKASLLESSQSEGWYTFFLQYRLMILRKCLFFVKHFIEKFVSLFKSYYYSAVVLFFGT